MDVMTKPYSSDISGQGPPSYLGAFVCNIMGDRAYLYLKGHELTAEVYNAKREITLLTGSQIRGGRDGNMPLDELIQLVQTIAAPYLFASYQQGTLRVFARDFQEIQKNQFLKPRIAFTSKHFTCVRREETLNKLQKSFQEKQIVIVLNDPSVPLKRVGKTEIVAHYFEEHRKEYIHAFWIQAFDPWYFQKDMEKMAISLQISIEKIQEWLSDNTSYLIVFDGIEDHHVIRKYLPQSPKGHIVITSRDNLFNDDPLKIGLFAPEEGIMFLCANAKGSEEDAQRVTQSLGHVPSSLYRAVETVETEDLALSGYLDYCQVRLDEHAERAKETSNLPSRNKDFVGREPGLVALEESFSKNKPVVLAANAGLGGIGKTQSALQYAYRTCPNYNLIWWINCGNMQISYDDLAKKLGVHITDEEKRQENGLIKRVNLYLEGKPGWLLIFDNAQDEKSLEGLLPRSGGHILITSRNPTWDKTQTEVFGIEVFKREESIDLILKVTSRYDQEKEAGQLAEQLQDLPLAIAQAAAYIRETKISIQEYIEDFKKVHIALWNREEATNNYESTVSVTWNISMEKIQEIEKKNVITPQPIALPLMQICSFFASNDIPREALLLKWLTIEYEASQRNADACVEDLIQTLKLLEQFSMIGISGANISVHALVQTVVRDQMCADKQQKVYGQAFEVMILQVSVFEQDNISTWDQPKRCLPHGIALHDMAYKKQNLMVNIDSEKQYHFMDPLGQLCEKFGNLHQALKINESCLSAAEDWHKSYCSIQTFNAIGVSHTNIGATYVSLGNYDKADEHIQKASAVQQQILDNNQSYVNKSFSKISEAYRKLDNSEKGLEQIRKAWEIQLENLVENHPNTAISYNNIGFACSERGEFKQALQHYNKALKIQLQVLGEDHPSVATSYHNIAVAYSDLGEFKEALEFHQQALKIRHKVLGENHPDVGTSYNNIGIVCGNLEKYEMAMEYHERALKIALKVFGESHSVVSKSHINIGTIYQRRGSYEKALAHYKNALKIQLNALGEGHPDVAASYNNIGAIYSEVENYKEALDYHCKALKIKLQVFGENHHEVAKTHSHIGAIYSEFGMPEETLKHYQRALEIELQVFGEYHSDVAKTHSHIGTFYLQVQRDYKQALEHYQKALKIRLQVFDENHHEVAMVHNNIGAAYLLSQNFNEAVEHLKRAFVSYCNKYEQPHSGTIDILKLLIFSAKKLSSSRERILGTTYALCVQRLGVEHELTQELGRLVPKHQQQFSKDPINFQFFREAKSLFLTGQTAAPYFSCLQNNENSLIYDIPPGMIILEKDMEKRVKTEPQNNVCFYSAIRCLFYKQSAIIADQTYSKSLLQFLEELAEQETFVSQRLFAPNQAYQVIDKSVALRMIDAHKHPNCDEAKVLQAFSEDGKYFERDFPLYILDGFIDSELESLYNYLMNDYFAKQISCYSQFLKDIPLFVGIEGIDESSMLLEKLQVFTQDFLARTYDFKTSAWNPNQNIDDLLVALREYGPMIVAGQLGKTFYKDSPIELANGIPPKTVRCWTSPTNRINNPKSHFIILVGVIKIKTSSNGGGDVYFVDPNDLSDPDHPENDVLYKISYQNLKAHTKKSELMKSYGIHM